MDDHQKSSGRIPDTDRLETVDLSVPVRDQDTLIPRNHSDDTPSEVSDLSDVPESIGRYRIERILGRGGFGEVYLAHDDDLQRLVTIKVPHRRFLQTPNEIERFLQEARTLARLEHSGIVPVHDVGRTDDGVCYLVSRFIDGTDLSKRMRESPIPVRETVELIRTVAESLHYVHTRGVVHRDVKPGNILLDKRGQPFIVDFGLALLEEEDEWKREVIGTPSYMSPEQARGEGHLIDGRSDIFSLGVVLYQMLTGRRPFEDDDVFILLEKIQRDTPVAPRQIDRNIPRELERICLKSLSKRAVDRYATALDLAEDLRLIAAVSEKLTSVQPPRTVILSDSLEASQVRGGVIPKGLRSFDEGDADFFLNLLPGPKGRDGVPDSIRFWRRRINERNAPETFRVGVIYGPSGCGKSSFVKAGLIPNLDRNVLPVFTEAEAGMTESRLLNSLRRRCQYVSTDLSLRETMAELRRRHVMGAGTKVLVVIDQFEQWLYSTPEQQNSELALALRQCDGEHVQCILLVRDDFWLSLSRFMADIEVELGQNHNMLLVDLFDRQHARKVLTEFGCAYDRMPFRDADQTRAQSAFLDQAIDGLSQDDKVIPIRLALFAEMVKTRPWTTATLRQIGGIEGVGVLFLDECFTGANAPAEYSRHLSVVQATLKQLLPDSISDLKGHMRSRDDLLAASGCADRPAEFDAVVRILDGELRLITPSESESPTEDSSPSSPQYYQLTHDFLVPTLREWLDRYRRGSRRGRAEILLKDRADVWNSARETRQLPSWGEWASILTLTRRRTWTDAQRAMMRVATRRYSLQLMLICVALLLAVWGRYEWRGRSQADLLVEQLKTADVARVPELVDELMECRRWSLPRLRELRREAEPGSRDELFSSLALLRQDESLAASIATAIPSAETDQLIVIRDALLPFAPAVKVELWKQIDDQTGAAPVRFKSALVLASIDPPRASTTDSPWSQHGDFLTQQLIDVANGDRDFYRSAIDLIHPARAVVLDHLSDVFRDREATDARRFAATNLLKDLLKDEPVELTRRFLDGTLDQFQTILETVDRNRLSVEPVLEAAAGAQLDASQTSQERLLPANRKSLAAGLLLRYGSQDRIWNLLADPLPDARCYFIHRLRPLGIDPELVVQRLTIEEDASILAGLIQALGEYPADELRSDAYLDALETARSLYLRHPDPRVHASLLWLLTQWGQSDWLSEAGDGLRGMSREDAGWYVDGHGNTMVHIDMPGAPFEIAMQETTVQQFLMFDPDLPERHSSVRTHSPTPDCPVGYVDYRDVTSFCNWLTLEEGLGRDQLCYPEPTDSEPYVQLYPDYRERRGYRLPTADEWSFAEAGMGLRVMYFPYDAEIARKYVVCDPDAQNRSWPIGRVKPNGFGLFDMAGSLREWVSDASPDPGNERRAFCGFSYKFEIQTYFEDVNNPRAAFDAPSITYSFFGFRIARSAPDPNNSRLSSHPSSGNETVNSR